MARAAATSTLTRLLTISKRLLPTTSVTHPPFYSHAVRSLPFLHTRFTSTDAAASESSNESWSPLGIVSIYGDWGLTRKAMMFPGMDYEHWFVIMRNPGGKGASKEEMIDCYVKTLAQAVGSEEEAKKKIYKVNCDPKFRLGFGCQLDWETAHKLEELPEVSCISADFYHQPENKDYGGELFVNGEIVQRSPNKKGGPTH